MTFHSKLTANHITYTGSFADEAARLAGTYVAADVGKSYLQVDTNTQWRLKSVSPLFFIQETGIEKTTADMDIYLDDAAGSDTTGDGSLALPFKTFTRVFEEFQDKEIRHTIRIFPVTGTYDEFPAYTELKLFPGGRVILDATKNAYTVSASYTIASFAGIGPPNVAGDELGTEITVAALPPGPDPHYGLFLHFKSGNYDGKVLAIAASGHPSPNTIRTMWDSLGFANSDAFDVVDCPVKIDVSHTISIVGISAHKHITEFFTIQLAVAGIEFKCGVDSTKTPFFLENINAHFNFCKLIDRYDGDDFSIPLALSDVKFNFDFFTSGTFDDDNLEDWSTGGFQILGKNADPFIANGFDVNLHNQTWGNRINKIFCRRRIIAATRYAGIMYSHIAGITNRPSLDEGELRSTIRAENVLIHQVYVSDTCLELSNCCFFCDAVYIHQGGRPVDLADGSFFRSLWFHGDLISAAFALRIGWNSTFHIDLPSSRTTIIGSTGAIEWPFDSSTVVSWPSEGSFLQKAASFVVSPGEGG